METFCLLCKDENALTQNTKKWGDFQEECGRGLFCTIGTGKVIQQQ